MRETRTINSKQNMRYGELLLSTTDAAQIGSIEVPKLTDNYNIIKAEDIPGLNGLNAFGTTMPLLATGKIMFKGQPIMAIIGPDYESVTIASRETKVLYNESELSSSLFSQHLPEEKTLQWGNIESILEKEDIKKYETSFSQNSFTTHNYNYIKATAWRENEITHIEVPCQWPELLKRTAADAISSPLKNIVIHPLPYNAPNDEYLFNAVTLGALAVVCCIKTNSTIELRTKIYNHSPSYTVKRTTYANKENKMVAEEVEMNVDLGAFPFGSVEYQRQALTGLIPNYSLNAFKARVTISNSSSSPRSFFGSLGYADALAATEYHVNYLSTIFGINPLDFRLNGYPKERRFTDYIPSFELDYIKKLSQNVADESKYLRKWSSYSLQKGDFSLLSFTRGIGLASGVGISGFSTTYAQSTNFQAQLTLTENNNLLINTSFPKEDNNREQIWKDIALEETNLKDSSSVIFLDFDTNTLNSGPDILNAPLSKFSKQLLSGCRKIVQMDKIEKRPFSIIFDVDNKLFPCEFENLGFGAIVVEVVINKTTFLPTVTEVWAHFRVGSIHNRKQLINQLKEEIVRTLDQCGANLKGEIIKTTDLANPNRKVEHLKSFKINLTLTSDNTDNISDMKSAIQGMTKSAYYQALSQSLGKNIPPLPLKSAQIERVINKGDRK